LCCELLTICWSDLFHGAIIEFSSWKFDIAKSWLLYNGDNYMSKIEWPCLNIVQVEWNFNSWRNFKSFNNFNTFQYSSSNRMDTLLIPILLVGSSLATFSSLTSHCTLNLTSLKMSTTVTFGGGRLIFWTPSNAAKSLQNSWSLGNHLLCWHVYTFFHNVLDLWDIMCAEQNGAPSIPFGCQPYILNSKKKLKNCKY